MLFFFVICPGKFLEIINIITHDSRQFLHLCLNVNRHCQIHQYTGFLCHKLLRHLTVSQRIMRAAGGTDNCIHLIDQLIPFFIFHDAVCNLVMMVFSCLSHISGRNINLRTINALEVL